MIVLLFTLFIILTNHATNTEISDIDQEKSYYEIQYLNSRLIEMANALNGLNKVNSSSLVINWEEMQDNLEILYTYWNSVILDLNRFWQKIR